MSADDFINEPVASTRVWHQGVPYDVSTINRQSSAVAAADLIYAETLVWTVKPNGDRDRLIGQAESWRDSIAAHQRIVEQLQATGSFDEE